MKFTGRLKQPVVDFVTGSLTMLFEPAEDFKIGRASCRERVLCSV